MQSYIGIHTPILHANIYILSPRTEVCPLGTESRMGLLLSRDHMAHRGRNELLGDTAGRGGLTVW